jgi:predicted O-methyltransferase YrrM
VSSAAAEYQRRLTVWSDIQGHLKFLHDTAVGYRKPWVIELGVAWGNSTSALLSAAVEADGILWSIDAGEVRTTNMIPADWWDDPRWEFLKADDLSGEAQAWLPGGCDVLFVDSDHSRDHVLAVLDTYMHRVRPGGIALFHDTQWQYPDTDLGKPEGDIAKALDLWCAAHGIDWENRPGSNGLGVIRL